MLHPSKGVCVCVCVYTVTNSLTDNPFSLPSSDPAEYSVYRPALILFGLVDQLQQALKVMMIDMPLWCRVHIITTNECGSVILMEFSIKHEEIHNKIDHLEF